MQLPRRGAYSTQDLNRRFETRREATPCGRIFGAGGFRAALEGGSFRSEAIPRARLGASAEPWANLAGGCLCRSPSGTQPVARVRRQMDVDEEFRNA